MLTRVLGTGISTVVNVAQSKAARDASLEHGELGFWHVDWIAFRNDNGVMYLIDTAASCQAFIADPHVRRTETEAALFDVTRTLCPETPIT
jgi:hypothetical protein